MRTLGCLDIYTMAGCMSTTIPGHHPPVRFQWVFRPAFAMIRLLILVVVAVTTYASDPLCCDCPSSCQGQGDVVFLIDRSGSLKQVDYKKEQGAVGSLINCLGFNAQHFWGSIVSWSHNVATMNTFASPCAFDASCLTAELGNLPVPSGQTFTWLALNEVVNKIIPTRRCAVKIPVITVIFTDGGSDNKTLTMAAAASLQAQTNSFVVVVGVGAVRPAQFAEIINLAGSNGHYFFYNSYDDVQTNVADICAAICNKARPMCCPPYYLVPRPWPYGPANYACSS